MMISLLSALALSAAQPIEQPIAPRVDWPVTLNVARDPITDMVTAFAVARAPNGELRVGCDPDRYDGLRVFLRGDSWIVGNWLTTNLLSGGRRVTHRFDESEPQRLVWNTDEGTAELRASDRVIPFVQQMMNAQRLALRTRDVEGREVDYLFPLDGARPALEEVLRTCGAQRLLLNR